MAATGLSAAQRMAEDRPRLATAFTLALAVLAAPLAVVAAQEPRKLALALAFVGVAGLALVRVEVSVLLLVAAAPLEDAFQLSANPQLTITKLAGALCFTSFAIHAVTSGRRLFFDRTHVMVLGLLGFALLSTLFADEFGAAKSTTIRYASFAAMYFVISQFAGNERLQTRIAWTLSLAGGLAAAMAVDEFISGRSTQARLPYGDPNDMAYMFATTLPLTLWLLHRPRTRPIVLLLAATMSAAILLSFSRGALVGLAAALVWYVLTERRGRLLVTAAVVLTTIVGTALLVRANPEQVESGFQAKQKVAAANVETRIDAWAAAARLSTESPLGVGPGNFRFHYLEETGRPPGTGNIGVVHNAYLDVAAELGLAAMVVFLLYLGTVFLRAGIARRRGSGPPGLAAAVRTALVVACVSAVFLSEQYYAPFWLLGALATALWREGEREPEPEAA